MASVTTPATGGGTETWSDATGYTRIDGAGVAVEQRPLTAAEAAWLPGAAVDQSAQQQLTQRFAHLKTLIGSVDLITTQAEQDVTHADVRQGQIGDWSTAATAHAATIRGIASPTVAQIREELAVACERDVRIAAELDDFYQWRSVVDQLLELLSQCVGGLARVVTRTSNGAP